jgi:hypothetical protein
MTGISCGGSRKSDSTADPQHCSTILVLDLESNLLVGGNIVAG